jgi:hypothetical protein
MCCEPQGSDLLVVGECPDCGGPIDMDGDSTEICGYQPDPCPTCGYAPCTGYC